MRITLSLVGLLREYSDSPQELRLSDRGTTVGQLIHHLSVPPDLVAIASVNGVQRPRAHRLCDGDVVKLLPIVGGG